ncbi:copper amine oxidase domain-containing protein [Clostridium aceticum]|uniref:Copper amine oxidase domain-containing protein n=1 Tax=Clostridium aceticum TaxID=84022 RepID=A0A0G3W737_9CLOT|nr:CAP domain-containing protein [Clostridium aceticum]AKL94461.1 copper amine oxidase domain-containing protein [Clostridium aceticum]
MKLIKRMIIILSVLWLITVGIRINLLQSNSRITKSNWHYTSLVKNSIKLENVEERIINVLIKPFNDHVFRQNKPSDKDNQEKFALLDIRIGDSVETVLEKLGQPARQDASQYGFQWYIYNQDYSKYFQIGIQQDKVVGLYTNSPLWQSKRDIQVGADRKYVVDLLGNPLEYIKKANTIYYLTTPEESHTYLIDNYYATIFFDLHNDQKVTAIQLIEKTTEEALQGFYGGIHQELADAFEKQVFDLANATRARFGLPLLQWEEKAAIAARKHSKDMAMRNYFAHESPSGIGPSDRIEKEGLAWRKSGENIAAGQTSAIYAHENWMNSLGHRENILGDFERLGVGVYFGGEYRIYYTQEFYTPL